MNTDKHRSGKPKPLKRRGTEEAEKSINLTTKDTKEHKEIARIAMIAKD
jgi:hypothetical protein